MAKLSTMITVINPTQETTLNSTANCERGAGESADEKLEGCRLRKDAEKHFGRK